MRPWTEAETKELRLRWVAGEKTGEIAKALNRTRGAISGKLQTLGWPTTPDVAPDPTPPSPAMIRLAEFDPVVARALRERIAA